jgi:hypothetical protein
MFKKVSQNFTGPVRHLCRCSLRWHQEAGSIYIVTKVKQVLKRSNPITFHERRNPPAAKMLPTPILFPFKSDSFVIAAFDFKE